MNFAGARPFSSRRVFMIRRKTATLIGVDSVGYTASRLEKSPSG